LLAMWKTNVVCFSAVCIFVSPFLFVVKPTMSMSSSFCWIFLCLASSDAGRIKTNVAGELKTEEQNRYGASCETLHSRFQVRSKNLHDFVDSYTGSDDMSMAARARSIMKASAVLRTLRRGSDCPWAVAGNSEDLEAVGKVVRSTIASNPCAPAAMKELQLMDTDGEEGLAPLARAMAILMSDTCEVEENGQYSPEADEIVDDLDPVETEELVQDKVEEMMESEGAESSLVDKSEMQSALSFKYVGKLIGAIMLGVLVALGCGFAGVLIGLIVSALFMFILMAIKEAWTGNRRLGHVGNQRAFMGLVIGAYVGGAGSVALCGAGFHQAVKSSGFLLNQ